MYKCDLNRKAFEKAMINKNFSPLQLALEANICDNTVYRVIRSGKITLTTLHKIANALEVLPTDLVE